MAKMEVDADVDGSHFLDQLKQDLNDHMIDVDVKRFYTLLDSRLTEWFPGWHQYIQDRPNMEPGDLVDFLLNNNYPVSTVLTILRHVLGHMKLTDEVYYISFEERIIAYERTHGTVAIGRETEVEDILQDIEGAAVRAVWLHGLGGIGKTTCVEKVCEILKTQGRRHLILNIRLADITDMTGLYVKILQSIQCKPLDKESLLKRQVIQQLDEVAHDSHRLIVVLDNIEGVFSAEPSSLRDNLVDIVSETSQNVKWLMTSRLPLYKEMPVNPPVKEVALQPLSDVAAKILMRSMFKQIPDADIAMLLDLSGNLPLAIGMLADLYHNTKHRPNTDDKRTYLLDKLHGDGKQISNIMSYAFESLHEVMQQRLVMLSVLQSMPFTLEEVRRVLNIEGEAVSMACLVAKQLVIIHDIKSKDKDPRESTQTNYTYRFHSLILEFLTTKQERYSRLVASAKERFCIHTLRKVEDYVKNQDTLYIDSLYNVVTNNSALLQTFFQSFQNQVISHQINLNPPLCSYLTKTISLIYTTKGRKLEVLRAISRKHDEIGHSFVTLFFKTELMGLLLDENDTDQAEREGQEIWHHITALQENCMEDERLLNLQAKVCYQYGRIHRRETRFNQSLENLNNALKSLTEIIVNKVHRHEYSRTFIIGLDEIDSIILLANAKRCEDAISKGEYLIQQLDQVSEHIQEQTYLKCAVYYQMGSVYRQQKNFHLSCENFNKVILSYTSIEPKWQFLMDVARVNDTLGNTFYSKEDKDKALQFHQQAVEFGELLVGSNYHPFVSSFEFNVGTTYASKAGLVMEHETANKERLCKQALHIFDSCMDKDKNMGHDKQPVYVDKLEARAVVLRELGNYERAIEDRDQQIKIYKFYYDGLHPGATNALIHKADIMLKLRGRLMKQRVFNTDYSEELLIEAIRCLEKAESKIKEGAHPDPQEKDKLLFLYRECVHSISNRTRTHKIITFCKNYERSAPGTYETFADDSELSADSSSDGHSNPSTTSDCFDMYDELSSGSDRDDEQSDAKRHEDECVKKLERQCKDVESMGDTIDMTGRLRIRSSNNSETSYRPQRASIKRRFSSDEESD